MFTLVIKFSSYDSVQPKRYHERKERMKMSKYYLYIDKNGHNSYSIALESEYETLKKMENISLEQVKEVICKYASLIPEYFYNGLQALPYYLTKQY